MGDDDRESPIWEYGGHQRRHLAWKKARSGAAATLGGHEDEAMDLLYTIPEDATSNWRRIVQECLDQYGLTLADVRKAKDRPPGAILCSQEIAYRLRTFGRRFGRPMSVLDIGDILNRDHSTILHSIKVHAARLAAARPQFKPEDEDE